MWRVFVVFSAFVLCISTPASAAEIMSPRAFTDAFAATAHAAMPSAQVDVKGDLNVETRAPGGEATVSDLHNAYNRYRATPEHLQEILRGYVATLAEAAQATATVDRSHIVPILKNKAWVDGTRKVLAALPPEKASEPLTEPFNGKLTIVYVEDRAHSMRFLTTRDDVGDRMKLHNLALANLGRLLGKMEMRGAADGLWLISAGGNYEASLLLADSIWSSGQIKVDGDIVAAVPAKDALIVTGSRNAAGIARLRKVAADLARGPYALTPALFVYRDGKFIEFEDSK
jgi:uncharacterized protein YtpQ (UPF0354 family)